MKNNKQNEDLYGQEYYQWQGYGFASTTRSDHKRIIELLNTKKINNVLEIGCGLGILLDRINAKKKVGTETNDYAISQSRKLGIKVIKNDAEKGLPFKDGEFDAIILNEVIEHFRKPLPVMRDCYRILAPGGRIIISTPAKSFFAHDLTESHFSEITFDELRDLVKKFNLKIITHEVSGITFMYPILENVFFKPFRIARYFFTKKQKSPKGKATAVDAIDSFHALVDNTILKPTNRYRKFLLRLGQQQLILAEKV